MKNLIATLLVLSASTAVAGEFEDRYNELHQTQASQQSSINNDANLAGTVNRGFNEKHSIGFTVESNDTPTVRKELSTSAYQHSGFNDKS